MSHYDLICETIANAVIDATKPILKKYLIQLLLKCHLILQKKWTIQK